LSHVSSVSTAYPFHEERQRVAVHLVLHGIATGEKWWRLGNGLWERERERGQSGDGGGAEV
jgi:hypothetical protein